MEAGTGGPAVTKVTKLRSRTQEGGRVGFLGPVVKLGGACLQNTWKICVSS